MNEEAVISIALTDEEIKKFWSRTKREPDSDCIIWTGAKKETGYGMMKIRGKNWRAHRLSHIMSNGPIQAGMEILHSCNRPSCVNHLHLRAGTHEDNMKQAASQGRLKGLRGDLSSSRRFPECRPRGRMNHFSKLNEERVAEILFYYHWRAKSIVELSNQYSVSGNCIKDIINRKTWIHVPFPSVDLIISLTPDSSPA